MNLNEVLDAITTLDVAGDRAVEISGVAYDSREVKSGGLFVAIPGSQSDGADFITDAMANGAAAIVSENRLELGRGTTHLQVPSARRALADIANLFFGDLSRQLRVIGVTGTNGKTTTAFMIRDILLAGKRVPGLLGTVAYEIGERSIPASRTTPEAPDIHSMFKQMKEHGCDSVVMEVSSHAIALDRVHGIDFNIAVFTNLTQDHLDFHRNMDDYFDAKANLFEAIEEGEGRSVVINTDDPWGRKLLEERTLSAQVMTYGFNADAQIIARKIKPDINGTRFLVKTPWGEGKVRMKLLGRFNVHNALAALAVGGLSGVDFGTMVHALEQMEAIPGRLELVPNRKGRKIFVDYAHTDDALRNVLNTLREICKGRLIVVFGCGGNRDKGKREMMGRAACELADYSIVTSDNPRRENPGAIASDIVAGYDDSERYEVVLDRRKAIERGIEMMRRRDLLVVAGKGHETYQEFDGTIVPFDDREKIREIVD